MFRSAVIQFNVVPGDIEHNEKEAERLIREAHKDGAQMVVLGELWNCGYDLEHIDELAQDKQGSSVKLLQRLAKELSIYIVGGTIAYRNEGKFYNTCFVFNDEGEILGKYSKVHLFSLGLREKQYFTGGDNWGVVDTPWGKLGIVVCYDLRFPELVRNLATRGIKMLAVPAQWPTSRFEHWNILSKARAIENQIFVMSANRVGSDFTGNYPGHSAIINPIGDVLVYGDTEAGAFTADINIEYCDVVRKVMPILEDRVRILDEIDDSLI